MIDLFPVAIGGSIFIIQLCRLRRLYLRRYNPPTTCGGDLALL